MNEVTKETALNNAFFFMGSIINNFVIYGEQKASLRNCKLKEEPLVIFDVSGEILFYDFYMEVCSKNYGSIRCSANKITNCAVVSYLENPFDYNIEQFIRNQITSKYPDANNFTSKLICYSYPKIGVYIKYSLYGEEKAQLYDPYSKTIVIENFSDQEVTRFESDQNREGFSINPYFSINPEKLRHNIEFFDNTVRDYLIIFKKIFRLKKYKQNKVERLEDSGGEDGVFDYEYISSYFEKNPPLISSLIFPIRLMSQEKKDYCAMATAQMILSFFNIEKTQDEIAQTMNYADGGATPENQVEGFKKLLGESFRIYYDATPTWDEFFDTLNNFTPLKTAIPGHARVCRGWKKFIYLDPASRKKIREECYLLINDPYPVNIGSTYWESTDLHIYRNFISINFK